MVWLICYQAIIKEFGRPFQGRAGVSKALATFRLCNLTIAKQLAVWRLEHNGISLLKMR